MANYNKQKKSVGRVVAGVLCGVLCVAAVAGAGTALYMGATNNGWFDSEEIEENDNVVDESVESAGGLYVNETASNGIKLTQVKLTAEEYGNYGISAANVESAYTITVSGYNEDATNPLFDWLCSDSTSVTVTPSSDTKSCTVTCSAAFSTAVTITCCSRDNTSAYATCTVNYVNRLTGASFRLYDGSDDQDEDFTIESSGSTYTWMFNTTCGISTNNTTLYNISYSYGTGSYKENYSTTVTYTSNITNSTYTLTSDTFRMFLANISGVSSSLSVNEFKSEVYDALISAYKNSTAAAVITVKATGATTGETSTFTYNLIINPVNFYVSVLSVTLDQTNLYF